MNDGPEKLETIHGTYIRADLVAHWRFKENQTVYDLFGGSGRVVAFLRSSTNLCYRIKSDQDGEFYELPENDLRETPLEKGPSE